MTIDKEPLSPILIRFNQDLQFNGLKERSQESYCRAVRKFSEFLKREPDTASEDDLRNYLLFIKNDQHWAASTINVAQQGLKKFFKITCPQTWPTLKLLRVRGEVKLPVVISVGEVHTFLKLIDKPSMLCFFTVVYTLGLRLQEALNLQVADIDSKRMMVHIHRGQGARHGMSTAKQLAMVDWRFGIWLLTYSELRSATAGSSRWNQASMAPGLLRSHTARAVRARTSR